MKLSLAFHCVVVALLFCHVVVVLLRCRVVVVVVLSSFCRVAVVALPSLRCCRRIVVVVLLSCDCTSTFKDTTAELFCYFICRKNKCIREYVLKLRTEKKCTS